MTETLPELLNIKKWPLPKAVLFIAMSGVISWLIVVATLRVL